MIARSRFYRFLATALTAAAAWAVAAGPAPSAPAVTPPALKSSALVTFISPDRPEATLRLELPPIDEARVVAAKRRNDEAFLKRLSIGVGREAGAQAEASSARLTWVPVAGGQAARWEIRSPGAKALRVALAAGTVPAGLQLRFSGNEDATVYGPVERSELLAAGAMYWSPVVEGDTAIVEAFLPAGDDPSAVAMWVANVSHLFASPTSPKVDVEAKAASGSCEVNLICRAGGDAELARTGTAVAKITFSDSSGTFLCTGTVLSNTTGAVVPNFATAAHCISDQAAASTLSAFWFYETTTCTGTALNPNSTQTTGGAALLFTDTDGDFTLLRLNRNPPAGVTYAAWDAASLGSGSTVDAIHHPAGDVKKISLGTVGGFTTTGGHTKTFIKSNWNSTATGVTEGGSSGSGLFTGSANSGYKFRGTLLGGPSSCTATAADLYDVYSRFDLAYPSVAQFLSPTSCSYAISAASITFPATGGTGSFAVSSGGTCSWNAVSGSSWINTTSGGAGNGTVTFTVDANTGAARTGVITVGGQNFTVSQGAALATAADNYTALWSTLGESGWGLNLAHQGDTIFASIYTYFTDGQPMWLYGSNVMRQPDGSFTGGLFRATGPAFDAAPWGSIANTQVGTITLRFTSATAGTLQYTFNGTPVSKAITRFDFGAPVPVCAATTDSRATATNYQDLWWNPAESGWGLDIAHQGNIIFASLFTYDDSGRGLWLYASDASRQPDGSFSGALVKATGPAFDAAPWGSYTPVVVGNFTLRFASGETGTLTYNVGSRTVVKPLTRFPVGSPATVCR